MSVSLHERRQVVRSFLAGDSERGPGCDWLDTLYQAVAGRARCAVMVVGAHPWAGASTVAVALADAAAGRVDDVRLVDGASRDASGLACVADRELGVGREHCLLGRRGAVEVRRPAYDGVTPGDMTLPIPQTNGTVVIDAGWRFTELSGTPGWPQALLSRAPLALVCRATVPGTRRAEIALSQLDRSDVVVAALGARRLPGAVHAALGPRVKQAYDERRLVCLPHDRRLDVEGLDDSPMPKGVLAGAGRVWDALQVDSEPPIARTGES